MMTAPRTGTGGAGGSVCVGDPSLKPVGPTPQPSQAQRIVPEKPGTGQVRGGKRILGFTVTRTIEPLFRQ